MPLGKTSSLHRLPLSEECFSQPWLSEHCMLGCHPDQPSHTVSKAYCPYFSSSSIAQYLPVHKPWGHGASTRLHPSPSLPVELCHTTSQLEPGGEKILTRDIFVVPKCSKNEKISAKPSGFSASLEEWEDVFTLAGISGRLLAEPGGSQPWQAVQ